MKTRVYVTIDTECAEERIVAGKAVGLQGYDVRVWGRFRDQKRDLGIGLIMDELEAEGAAAGLAIAPRRQIPPDDDYIGSAVICLHG